MDSKNSAGKSTAIISNQNTATNSDVVTAPHCTSLPTFTCRQRDVLGQSRSRDAAHSFFSLPSRRGLCFRLAVLIIHTTTARHSILYRPNRYAIGWIKTGSRVVQEAGSSRQNAHLQPHISRRMVTHLSSLLLVRLFSSVDGDVHLRFTYVVTDLDLIPLRMSPEPFTYSMPAC